MIGIKVTQFFRKDTLSISPTMHLKISHPEADFVNISGMESTSVKTFTPHEIAPNASCTVASEQARLEKPGEFRLLSLPLELRRNIYSHYFVCKINSYDSRYRLVRAGKNCNIYCLRKRQTRLLAMNRQLYIEAREVLYGETIWHISFNSFGPRFDDR